MNDQIVQQLRILKLPGFREHLQARLLEAEANNLSYEDFLSMLLADEIDLRTSRRIDRLLHRAHLGKEMTLNPSINAKGSLLPRAHRQNSPSKSPRTSVCSKSICWSSTTLALRPSISNPLSASTPSSTGASVPKASSSLPTVL